VTEALTPNQRAWLRLRRNTPAVVSAAFLVLMLLFALNLFVDLAYGLLDPRVKYE
jgi:ABC-type dipeptide/oligopeptide/nickel transport system permease component